MFYKMQYNYGGVKIDYYEVTKNFRKHFTIHKKFCFSIVPNKLDYWVAGFS